MKLQKYPAYKDSGIEWIGRIPKHWDVVPGLKVFSENNRKNIGMIDDRVLSLSYGKIVRKAKEKLVGLVPESFETYQIVKAGDIIIRCTDLQNDKTSLRTALAKDDGIITSAYLNLNVKDGYPEYLHYLLHVLDITKAIYKLGSGLRQNLSFDDFKRLNIIFPSIKEQIQIVKYIDNQTNKIDKAINQKEKLIELLKEYRQIIINEAVTKGVDENGELRVDNGDFKDSGIEWIGRIPRDWEVRKLKYLFNFNKGLTITKENLQDDGIYCVNYGEIHSKFGFELNPEIHKLKCVSEVYLEGNQNALLDNGDFVFADTSEDIEGSGNFTYINSDIKTFAGYHTIICKPKSKINSRFFAYEFSSLNFKNQVRRKVKGVKVFSITQSILKDLFLWIPPQKEQEEIVEYIDNQTTKIDKAIQLQQNYIEKLKEYKATLIDSVVTGKVRVK